MLVLVVKCHVVEDSDTSVLVARCWWVTAVMFLRVMIRTVVLMIVLWMSWEVLVRDMGVIVISMFVFVEEVRTY